MDYDLAVIGAGWAGFNAALKAKAHGLKVVIIEKDQIGGTCLNRGCIPTKTLLQSVKAYSLAKKSGTFGIEVRDPQINFSAVQSRKENVMQQLRQGMKLVLGDMDLLKGDARILDSNTIRVGEKEICTMFILVASGSKPLELKDIKLDGKKIISSNEILNLKELPSSLLIIGGGVIGCEFASLFSAFGCQVTIVELTPQLLPGLDKEVARKIETIFKKKGVKVSTDTDAKAFNFNDYDLVLLCVGRAPATEGLGLDEVGVRSVNGMISVDDTLKTDIPNIYAAGDCASKTMLAHFAAYQGCIAAENIAEPLRTPRRSDSSCIPSCIFTDPEIGAVGITEEEAKRGNIDVGVNKFDFLGSGMARILDETNGFIKIISNKSSGDILGASIIGPRATELIGILSVAVQSRLKVSQMRDTILAHPTLSEGITSALKEDGI
ncbi:MAG: dihydrolipoyl dehydrogenase [Candidatus Omnitrophota bacterium]